MKITTKCRYGIRAIVEIGNNYPDRPTTRREISNNQDLDDSYLENILLDLKSNQIVRSIRGVKGGFVLNKPPQTITLLDIVESLQGEIVPTKCVSEPESCNRSATCVTRPIWIKMQEAQKEVLENVTIQDLINQKMDVCHLEYLDKE